MSLIAGMSEADRLRGVDGGASREIPDLVRGFAGIPSQSREGVRQFARSLPVKETSAPRTGQKDYGRSSGALLVRMLELRNLGWVSAAKVMHLMSGVYLSAATIGAIGRGARKLDSELLNAFADVLGAPVDVLSCLTGVAARPRSGSAENADMAALIWEVRQLDGDQVREVRRMVDSLARTETES